MHAVERAHAAVRARPLHAHQPGRGRAHPRAAVALDRPARHLQRRDLRHQLERELRPLPVAVDDRRDLRCAELAQPVADAALVVGELLVEQVEVRHPPESATVWAWTCAVPSRRDGSTRSSCWQALVREPSTLGNERGVQELVAAELREIGLEPALWDVDPDVPGASPPLHALRRAPERHRDPPRHRRRALADLQRPHRRRPGHARASLDPRSVGRGDRRRADVRPRRGGYEGGRGRDARRGPGAARQSTSPATSTSRP